MIYPRLKRFSHGVLLKRIIKTFYFVMNGVNRKIKQLEDINIKCPLKKYQRIQREVIYPYILIEYAHIRLSRKRVNTYLSTKYI